MVKPNQFDTIRRTIKRGCTKSQRSRIVADEKRQEDLAVGDRLSQTEYAKAQEAYGFQRFVEQHYRVTKVHHSNVSLKPGDRLTAEAVDKLKAEIRDGFDGEWHYLDSETDARLAAEVLTEAGVVDASLGSEERDATFKRVYRVTEKTSDAFPYEVGDEVPTEEITPWLTRHLRWI